MRSESWWQAALPENWQVGGFGLYLHWPFCQSKCPYCDFNSHVAAEIDQDRWRRAYVSELSRVAAETPGRVLSSVFFGGGTPSLMDPELVLSILETVFSLWTPANTIEITLEANPSSVEAGRFAAYRYAGVNRVSLGVQALNDPDLQRLGRLHSAHEARAAIDVANSVFDRVSFDLIYARQDQPASAWKSELSEALQTATGHLSLYQLTIEPGTAFGARFESGRLRGLPNEDLAADLYEITQELCDGAGLPAYEVSNHAAPDAESRHNLIYWRGGDYLGVGPGAHGRLTLGGQRLATTTPFGPTDWLMQVERSGNGEAPRQSLSAADQAIEYAMMGLRLREGIDMARYTALGGVFDQDGLQELTDLGLIQVEGDQLATTPEGRPVLNAVLRGLL